MFTVPTLERSSWGTGKGHWQRWLAEISLGAPAEPVWRLCSMKTVKKRLPQLIHQRSMAMIPMTALNLILVPQVPGSKWEMETVRPVNSLFPLWLWHTNLREDREVLVSTSKGSKNIKLKAYFWCKNFKSVHIFITCISINLLKIPSLISKLFYT